MKMNSYNIKNVTIEESPTGSWVIPFYGSGYNSISFANDLLDAVGVVVTPGIGYGSHGEGYVRLSLTISDEELSKGLYCLNKWHSAK